MTKTLTIYDDVKLIYRHSNEKSHHKRVFVEGCHIDGQDIQFDNQDNIFLYMYEYGLITYPVRMYFNRYIIPMSDDSKINIKISSDFTSFYNKDKLKYFLNSIQTAQNTVLNNEFVKLMKYIKKSWYNTVHYNYLNQNVKKFDETLRYEQEYENSMLYKYFTDGNYKQKKITVNKNMYIMFNKNKHLRYHYVYIDGFRETYENLELFLILKVTDNYKIVEQKIEREVLVNK